MTDVVVDVLIVGAGPSGLYGAYYAGFRGLSVAVVDALPEPGGQVTALYPEKMIFDIAGFPAVKGKDLVEALVAQASPFKPHYLLGQQAISYAQVDDTQWAGCRSRSSTRRPAARCRPGCRSRVPTAAALPPTTPGATPTTGWITRSGGLSTATSTLRGAACSPSRRATSRSK